MKLRALVVGVVGCVTLFVCGCAAGNLRIATESGSPAARRKALQALMEEVTPEMRLPLERILKTDREPSVRALTADVLGQLGLRASAPELRQSLKLDVHWTVRERAATALADILGAAARDDIEHVLSHGQEPCVRRTAVALAATRLDGTDARKLLLDALKDEDPAVRIQACFALKGLTGKDLPPNYEDWKKGLGAEAEGGVN